MLGAIETGGTKIVCAVGDDALNIIERVSFPTTTPDETFEHIFNFFDQYDKLRAIGIGSFGPIDVNKESDTYGYITSTPKLAWQDTDFLGRMKARYDIPMGWTTDVNAAALGEYELGAAQGTISCVYITVGTGIGGGAVVDGKPLEGYGHPELGHMLVRLHPEDTAFDGFCPFHGTCLEGVAAGPAIEQRYGKSGQELAEEDHVWELEAFYLAQAIVNITLTLSPERIVLGGGVMKQRQIFRFLKKAFKEQLNDYVATPPLDEYLVPPALEDNAGITGGLLLAKRALQS